MMKTNVILVAASVAAAVGMATAGDVRLVDSPAASTAGAQLAHFTAFRNVGGFHPGLVARQRGPIGFGGGQGAIGTLNFGLNGTATVQQFLDSDSSSPGDSQHAFYLGTALGLSQAQNNWFNTVGGVGGVGENTTVLGFGNLAIDPGNGLTGGDFSANRVQMIFNPGVQGFAFNFADVGDVDAVTELRIRYRDDGEDSVYMLGGTTESRTGFFSLMIEAGRQLDRIMLTQTPGLNGQDPNDGFLLYGFTTLTVVPLPPAAWAGLAMLGGVAGVRKLRRR
jgi:hypothetical protein